MKMRHYPQPWGCMLSAFATIVGKDPQFLIDNFFKHDGSEIISPDHAEPYNRRGFHPADVFNVAYMMGRSFTLLACEADGLKLFTRGQLLGAIETRRAIICGSVNGAAHCVPWDGWKAYHTETGEYYDLSQMEIEIAIVDLRLESKSE